MTGIRQSAIIGVLLILLALGLWLSPGAGAAFDWLSDAFAMLVARDTPLALLVFTGLAALSAMVAPLSSVPLVPFAITAWGELPVLSFLLAGWLLGGAGSYAVGRYAAYPFIKKFAAYDTVTYYRDKMSTRKQFWFVMLFRLAMPAELPGYVLGGLRYSFGKYMVATLVPELIMAVFTIYATRAFLAEEVFLFIGILIAGVGFLLLFIRVFHDRLKLR